MLLLTVLSVSRALIVVFVFRQNARDMLVDLCDAMLEAWARKGGCLRRRTLGHEPLLMHLS